MNVMSGYIAVVVAFMIVTTEAVVLEYTEEALASLQHTDPDPVKHSAKLINSDIEIRFKPDTTQTSSGFILYPMSTSSVQQRDGNCENTIGIEVDEEAITCNIVYIRVSVDELRSVHSLQFILAIQPDRSAPSKQINIPILAVPSAYASANEQLLKNWAKENDVGLLSPFNSENLQNILENKQVTLGFKWLSDLLTHGVFRLKDYKSLGVVVTRPIALQKDLIQGLLNVAESRKSSDRVE